MDVFYEAKALKTLDAKLEFVKGKGSRKLAYDLAAAVELGNEHDRLAGLNRYGQPVAPVKKRRGKYAGAIGPPLVPYGAASRAITHFKAVVKGSKPPYRILAGWKGVVSAKGVPFLPFLNKGIKKKPPVPATGTKKPSIFVRAFNAVKLFIGSAEYLVPPRPFFGISPNTWKLIKKEVADFKAKVRKVK